MIGSKLAVKLAIVDQNRRARHAASASLARGVSVRQDLKACRCAPWHELGEFDARLRLEELLIHFGFNVAGEQRVDTDTMATPLFGHRSVMKSTEALLMPYTPMPAFGRNTISDATLMIEPSRFVSTSRRATACAMKKGAQLVH